jgi:hypothetical protein
MLKKIKSIFVVEDEMASKSREDSSQEKTNQEAPAESAAEEPKAEIPIPTPEVSAQNRFFALLAQTIEKNNQPGYDYFEFRQSLINLSKLNMDEATKFKSAYAAAQAMGITPASLLSSAQGYLNLMNQESQKFAAAEQNQRTKVVEERKTELSNLQTQIDKKKELILQIQNEIEQMTRSLEAKKEEAATMNQKLALTKAEFEAAMKSISGQIADDIQKMNQYLK